MDKTIRVVDLIAAFVTGYGIRMHDETRGGEWTA